MTAALGFMVVLGLLVLALWVHSITSPKFGNLTPWRQQPGRPKPLPKDSDHFFAGRFHNLSTHQHNTQPRLQRMIKGVLGRHSLARPPKLSALAADFGHAKPAQINRKAQPKLTWLGHSSVLMSTEKQRVLFDPVFGAHASPFKPFARRFAGSLIPNLAQLPCIDIVLISHDHYDHLDFATIRRFDHRFKHYVVPLGVGAHLIRFGVKPTKITELDWWQQTHIGALKVTLTPAHHSSGRSIIHQKSSLWGGFAVQSGESNVFFSGDSGYGGHFAQIGERLGPFDLAMIECGQYHSLWPTHHMLPSQSVQAALDVKADAALPIHWGAFALAAHAWDEPVEWFCLAAAEANLRTLTPQIGQAVEFGSSTYPWWRGVSSLAIDARGEHSAAPLKSN